MSGTETDRLPASARNALLLVADLLRDRFTGRVVFDCQSGGVAKLRVEEEYTAVQLAKKNGVTYHAVVKTQ